MAKPQRHPLDRSCADQIRKRDTSADEPNVCGTLNVPTSVCHSDRAVRRAYSTLVGGWCTHTRREPVYVMVDPYNTGVDE